MRSPESSGRGRHSAMYIHPCAGRPRRQQRRRCPFPREADRRRTGAELVLASRSFRIRSVAVSVRRSKPRPSPELAGKAGASLGRPLPGLVPALVEQSSSAAHGLQAIAERIGADLIVVGSSPSAETGHTRKPAERRAAPFRRRLRCCRPDGFHRPGRSRSNHRHRRFAESGWRPETAVGLAPDGSGTSAAGGGRRFRRRMGSLKSPTRWLKWREATRESPTHCSQKWNRWFRPGSPRRSCCSEGTAPIQLAEASAGLTCSAWAPEGLRTGAAGAARLGLLRRDEPRRLGLVLVVPRTDQTND